MLRYSLAVILVTLVPMVIAFWIVMHGGHWFWKTRSNLTAYSVAGVAMLAVGIAAYQTRSLFIGRDLGMVWLVFLVGLLIYVASLRMATPIRRHLSFKTFAGVPELEGTADKLLTSGPFSVVRHPRYLMVIIGIIGWALMANFDRAYGAAALCIFGMWIVIQLEERELQSRFGEAYTLYKREVPQLFPKPGTLSQFWHPIRDTVD